MAKYMWQACYTALGTKGLLKAGGTKRRRAVEAALRTVGGTMEAYYYAFGDTDVIVIADVPDHVSMAAATMVINAAGAVQVRTTVLLLPEEIDRAAKKYFTYRPPR